MSNVSYYSTEARLSDSIEREMMRETLANGENLSASSMLKSTGRGIAQGFNAVFNYLVAVADVLNEARAQDNRHSRSYW